MIDTVNIKTINVALTQATIDCLQQRAAELPGVSMSGVINGILAKATPANIVDNGDKDLKVQKSINVDKRLIPDVLDLVLDCEYSLTAVLGILVTNGKDMPWNGIFEGLVLLGDK